jgi:hypothetical protein
LGLRSGVLLLLFLLGSSVCLPTGARQARLQQLKDLATTLIFYVPPHGLRAVLGDMVQVRKAAWAQFRQQQSFAIHCAFLPPSLLMSAFPPCTLNLFSLEQVLGPARRVCVARELAKMHEEFYR